MKKTCIVLVAILFGAFRLFALDSDSILMNGVYLGGGAAYTTVKGDFAGNSFLATSSEIIVIPSIDPGFGFGGYLGYRMRHIAVELDYTRSSHDGSWGGGKFDVFSSAIDFNFLWFPFIANQFQPYLCTGFGIPWLTVKDGGVDSSGVVGDAGYSGISLQLGIGTDIYLVRNIFLRAQGTYRLADFSSASGPDGDSKKINDSLNGNGLEGRVCIGFIF